MNLITDKNLIDKKTFVFLFCCLIIGTSIITRTVNLQEPLLSLQPFRQTQTALTVREFVENGVNLFYYKTPIFGPPFYCQFEFPVFQATVWLFHKATFFDIDTTCRLTSVFYYTLSALVFLFIVHILFQSALVSLLSIFQFAFLPFSMCWSRNSLIEYCVLFFCLLYVLLFLKLRESIYSSWKYLLSTSFVGIIAFTSKGTTAFPYALVVLLFIIYDVCVYWKHEHSRTKSINVKQTITYGLSTFLVLFIPFVCLYLWTRHTDLLKMESAFSYVATSKSLYSWNFGLLKDKLSLSKWIVILKRVVYTLSFVVVASPALIFPVITTKQLRKQSFITIVLVLVVVATIFTFFNLYYIHDYYLIAVLPIFCVVSALIIKLMFDAYSVFKPYFFLILFCLSLSLSFFIAYGISANKEYTRFFTYNNKKSDYETYRIAKEIEALTDKKDLVIITDYEWSSEVLYYANRKGLMWNDWNNAFLDRYKKDLQRGKYRLLITKNPKNNEALLDCFSLILLSEKENTYYYSIIGSKL